MKPKHHHKFWFFRNLFMFLLVGALSVWGLAYYIPFVQIMEKVDEQATALVLTAILLFAYGCVWAAAKITGRI